MSNIIFNSKKLLIPIILFILIIFSSVLWTPYSLLLYAQEKLTVDGDLEINSPAINQSSALRLRPQSQPATAVEGQIYYDNTVNQPYYYDGTRWGPFGRDKNVGTRIVAASDSLTTSKDRANFVCSGTNDQETIQQAIDDLGANPGVVYLLEGTYNISASINLNTTIPNDSGKAIIGTGAATVLKIVAGSSNVYVINASNVSRIFVSQLKVDGNNKTGSGNVGIYFSTNNSQISKVWAENMSTYGVYLTGSNNILSGSSIQSNGMYGVTSFCAYSIISGNNVQSNVSDGIYFAGPGNIVSGNMIWSNGSHGIKLLQINPIGNTISSNIIWSNSGPGIRLYQAYNNEISGNNIYSNNNYGIHLDYSSNNTISGNNLKGNTMDGIYLYYSSNNIASSNVIYDNGGSSNRDGIKIGPDADNNIISYNLLYDSSGTGYPINIGVGDSGSNLSENNYLVANHMSGWPVTYDRIFDNGTNTRYTDKIKMTLERAPVLTVTGSTITPSGPSSYIPVQSSGGQANVTTITATNKPIGDLLILEGTSSSNTVKILTGGNVRLGDVNGRILSVDDILTLLWNGTHWLELHWSDN